ncbi:hypothetical protein WJX84_009691, partial [Apatococcus fuscideae]
PHSPEDIKACLEETIGARFWNIRLRPVQGNPLRFRELHKLDVKRYKCAIVLCDALWLDPDADDLNGIETKEKRDFLRLDAMIMMVQLNVRKALELAGHPDINIICEKVAFNGVTRFEDRFRLPLAVSVNFTSHSAKMLLEVAYNPRLLLTYSKIQSEARLLVQDSSAFARPGEVLTWAELHARAATVDQVLLGYYEISSVMSGPIQATINPAGDEHSHELRVWNKGDQRMKLLAFTRASLAHTEIDGNDTLLNSVWLASEDLDAADDAATAEALTFSSQQAV